MICTPHHLLQLEAFRVNAQGRDEAAGIQVNNRIDSRN
jgi:hypothetical protein